MRYYVTCRAHPPERHYLAPDTTKTGREMFPDRFTHPLCELTYTREEVRADEWTEIPGALMMFEPFVALWRWATGATKRDRARAEEWNGGKTE